MSEEKKQKWIAGRALALILGLAFVLLGSAGIRLAQAQSQPQSAANVATAPNAAQKPASAQPAPKGMNTGIKIHGHWVIEVKNPDGTIATRREFDNSLQPSGQLGIAALLAGNLSSGGLAIVLDGNSVTTNFAITDGSSVQFSNLPASSPCTILVAKVPGPCVIASYSQSNGGYPPYIAGLCNEPTNSWGCSFNLSVSAPTLGSYLPPPPPGGSYSIDTWGVNGPATITLSGSITAAAAGSITDVETWGFGCLASITVQSCGSSTPNQAPAGTIFYTLTERNLDGVNGDPNSVSVSGGQSISATVTLSFGSSD